MPKSSESPNHRKTPPALKGTFKPKKINNSTENRQRSNETAKTRSRESDRNKKGSKNKKTQASSSIATTPRTCSLESREPDADDKQDMTTAAGSGTNSANLEDSLWYHGLISRDDVPRLLKKLGDFLVRYTELDDKSKSYVVSVMCQDEQIRHLVVEDSTRQGDTSFWMHKGRKFASIGEMIKHYNATPPRPLDGDVNLIRAVNRDQWELTHTQLQMGKKLGEGAFGIVYSGKLRMRGSNKIVQVAIKEAHKDVPMDKATKDELMHEARIMFQNQHSNIVRIYGVAATQPPICIVMELIKGGTLNDYVRLRTNIPKSELVGIMIRAARYCQHASSGLRFLHDQHVVHRDVAARNCLISMARGAQNHHTVKLSDFGLATGIKGEEKLKKNTRMPIKWLAPETLNRRVFNKSSDVWSFGVLIWEVFSQGEDPYPSCQTLKDVMAVVKSGGHMSAEDCSQVPPLVLKLLYRCWQKDPLDRPLMEDVKQELKVVYYYFLEWDKSTSKPTSKAKR